MKTKHKYHHIYELCKDHMHSYVLAEMVDGTKVDGIVTGLDDEYVYLAVPLEQQHCNVPHNQQSYGYPTEEIPEHGYPDHLYGYSRYGGYPGYGYYGYPGYGYGYPGYGYPPRRFRRLILPLAALTALSVLPWY